MPFFWLIYSLEKYDAATGQLLSRKRDSTFVSKTTPSQAIDVPDTIWDDEDTYVVLKIYENETYRHVMSETIVDSFILDLSGLD